LIALWKSKGETDSTRRFYLYFSESIAAGLPRPEPYVPANEVSPTGDDESADSADGSHSPRGGALDTLRRGLSKLGSGGAGRKNKSGSLQTDDSSAAKSPPVSPRATPSSPKRAISPKPTAGVANSSAASILTSSAGAVPTPAMSTGRPNRSLTEAAALKTKVESPYRTIPSDLWDDADVADTSTAITTTTTTTTATAAAAASRVASSSPVVTRSVAPQSDDVKFLEQLLSQPSVGGVQDMRVLSTRDDDDEDDDGFRMSLIDRPNEEFLKEVKLGKTRSEHKPVAKQPQPAAKPAAAKPRASGGGDVDPLAELEQVWLEQQAEAESRAVAEDIERQSAYVRSQRERVADSAMAAIDDMLVGLNDDAGATVPAGTNTEPILMAIPAPAEHVEEEESPYNMIPKGLGRPSFQRPAGQDPAVFQAKVAAISRASSTRAPVEVEPAPEDVDELMRELAADENVQLAMSMTTQDLKALDQIKVEAAEEPQGETANAAAGAAAADEWDFEADLQKAQDELATHLAELNGI
jgi:hypothetical protein